MSAENCIIGTDRYEHFLPKRLTDTVVLWRGISTLMRCSSFTVICLIHWWFLSLLQSPEAPEGKEASKVTKQEVVFTCIGVGLCSNAVSCCLYWLRVWMLAEESRIRTFIAFWWDHKTFLSLSSSVFTIILCSNSQPEGQRDCQRWVWFFLSSLLLLFSLLVSF